MGIIAVRASTILMLLAGGVDAHARSEAREGGQVARRGAPLDGEELASHGAPFALEGRVMLPDGRPAAGAVVVSSAGGLAEVRDDGTFLLELRVEPEVDAIELSAMANGPGGGLSAQRRVGVPGDRRATSAGTLLLSQSQNGFNLTHGLEIVWLP